MKIPEAKTEERKIESPAGVGAVLQSAMRRDATLRVATHATTATPLGLPGGKRARRVLGARLHGDQSLPEIVPAATSAAGTAFPTTLSLSRTPPPSSFIPPRAFVLG